MVAKTAIEGTVPVRSVDRLWVSPFSRVPYGATSGAVDAGDALGDPIKFYSDITGTVALPTRGRILTIKMLDLDDDTLAATIHIFNQWFTAAASDAAFTIADEDAVNWVASELFDAGTDIGASKVHVIKDVNVDYYAPAGALFAQLSTSGTPNIASAAVMPQIQIVILPWDE